MSKSTATKFAEACCGVMLASVTVVVVSGAGVCVVRMWLWVLN